MDNKLKIEIMDRAKSIEREILSIRKSFTRSAFFSGGIIYNIMQLKKIDRLNMSILFLINKINSSKDHELINYLKPSYINEPEIKKPGLFSSQYLRVKYDSEFNNYYLKRLDFLTKKLTNIIKYLEDKGKRFKEYRDY